jgi:hypothetical protein
MPSVGRIAAIGVLVAIAGCHRYVPIGTPVPPVGEVVAFQISDQGRVGLAERFGPGVARIEGRVLGNEGNDYVISVSRVAQIGGESSLWSGETIHLEHDFVGRLERRELAKTRTWLVAGGVTTAVVALIASASLTGFFGGDDAGDGPPDPPDTRIGRPIRP